MARGAPRIAGSVRGRGVVDSASRVGAATPSRKLPRPRHLGRAIVMSFRRHLPLEDITAIHKAAVKLGLGASRSALLGGLDPAFTASLAIHPSPAAQMLTDLHTLNGIEALTDGSVPLHVWLTNALDLTSTTRESEVFARALEVLGGAARTAAALPGGAELERFIQQSNSYLDLNLWRTRLGEIEGQVCRVEIGRSSFGTGFLVGPDLVITNHHVLEAVIAGRIERAEVTLRFDYKRLAGSNVVSDGTEHRLADDWLLDESPASAMDVGRGDPDPTELDYALVRLARAPGSEPAADRAGALRRWIVPAAKPHPFLPRTPLFIVQHPKSAPIKLALDTDAVVGLNGNGTRVRYRTNTEPGSSGSPCFDQDWNLVALHHAGDPDFSFGHEAAFNEGIPFAKIVAHLRRPGVGISLPPLPA
ncbi:Glutamate synthase [NADPH] large chain [Minicystis rosea]|nr:Glutamate synthase [NADPH] large chain [Minicystis rosea]